MKKQLIDVHHVKYVLYQLPISVQGSSIQEGITTKSILLKQGA